MIWWFLRDWVRRVQELRVMIRWVEQDNAARRVL